MKKEHIWGMAGVLAFGLAACGDTTDDLTDSGWYYPQADAPASMPDAGVRDGGSATDAPVATTYVWVVVQDTEQKACTTNGPGADIDAVALWDATGTARGWGKKGTATYTANPRGNACENAECSGGNCKYAAISTTFLADTLVSWTEGSDDGYVQATGDDSGYFSLNAGTLQIQISDLTGEGPAQGLKKGDMIRVFEVDKSYIAQGLAPDSCSCLPEHYTVSVQDSAGATVPLSPMQLAPENTTCSLPTVASYDGCGTTVFVVP